MGEEKGWEMIFFGKIIEREKGISGYGKRKKGKRARRR